MGPKLSVSVRVGVMEFMGSLLLQAKDGMPMLLFAAEVHRNYVGSVLKRLGDRMIVLCFLMILQTTLFGLDLELQRKVHCRIDETGNRREWNYQLGWSLVEAEAHLEPVVGNLEIPEAILDDDRHLVGESLG